MRFKCFFTTIILVLSFVMQPVLALNRYSGPDRYATAVEISKTGWESGADVVVLARGDLLADAFAGVPLAFANNAPILLTKPTQLSTVTKDEICRLGATKVYILGQTAAISQAVEDEILAMGLEAVRIGGSNRFATAAEIAAEIAPYGANSVFLVSGLDFPDALTAASYAAISGSPILLTLSEELPFETSEAIQTLDPKNVFVVGGQAVISDEIMEKLNNPERISGSDRYLTALALARKFNNSPRMYFASGDGKSGGADAVTGAALAAKMASGLLLVGNTLPNSIAEYLNGHIQEAIFLGGEGAISPQMAKAIEENLFVPPSPPGSGDEEPEVPGKIDGFIRLVKTDVAVKKEIMLMDGTKIVDGFTMDACLTTTAPDPLESAGSQYRVSGNISSGGKPIPDAQVILWSGERGFGTTTDEDGNFQILRPTGTYTLEIKAPGYKTFSKEVKVEDSDTIINLSAAFRMRALASLVMPQAVSFGLEPLDTPHTVSGKVFDEAGNPVKGVVVSATSTTEEQYYAQTDSEGNYSLLLEPGEYIFFTSLFDYRSFGTPLRVDEDIDALNWTLDYVDKEIITARGRLIDVDGTPIDGASVGVWSSCSGDMVFTDSQGYFEVKVPAGNYNFHLKHKDHFPQSHLGVPVPGDIEWEMKPVGALYTVEGQVTDGVNPVSDAMVIAFNSFSDHYEAYDTTDENGMFSLKLPEGDFAIEAMHSDYFSLIKDIKVPHAENLEFALTHKDLLTTVQGIVTNEFGPVPGALVVAIDESIGNPIWVETDLVGRYSILLDKGTYTFTAEFGNYRTAGKLVIDADTGQYLQKDWHMKNAGELFPVTVVVKDRLGDAVQGALVWATCEELNYFSSRNSNFYGEAFLFLYAGSYSIEVQPEEGFQYFWESGYTISGPDTVNIELAPTMRTVTVSGSVYDGEGIPLANVGFFFYGPEDFETQSGEDGSYSIELPAGDYEVIVFYNDGDYFSKEFNRAYYEDSVEDITLNEIGERYSIREK